MKQQFNIAIVEDEIPNSELIQHLLEKHFNDINIIGVATNLKNAQALLKQENIDIALLDINLNNNIIFEILSVKEKLPFQIIFITGYQEFAIEAIKAEAVDYLLKPLNVDAFLEAIKNAKERCKKQLLLHKNKLENIKDTELNFSSFSSPKVAIFSNNEIQLINIHDIIYLSAQRQYTIYHLISGEQLVSSKNLGDSIKAINSSSFLRIHKSYTINVNHLSKIDKNDGHSCILTNGASLPISQRKYKELIQFIG